MPFHQRATLASYSQSTKNIKNNKAYFVSQLLERVNQLMKLVNLRTKIVAQLVLLDAQLVPATWLLYTIKLPKLAVSSATVHRQYLATAPGDKKVILQCLVIKIEAASYSQVARYNLMIQKLPAKIPLVSSFQGYKFKYQQVQVSCTQVKKFHAFRFFSQPTQLLAKPWLASQIFYLSRIHFVSRIVSCFDCFLKLLR